MEVDITTSVWTDCLEIIKQHVDEQNFNTWFKPIEPVRTEGDVLTIQVPSQFFYEWLEENYVPVLKKAVRQVLGETGRLEYSVVVDSGNLQNPPVLVNYPNGNGVKKNHPTQENTRGENSPVSYKAPHPRPVNSRLNPNYSFDNFVEGDCNRLARSAGVAVAQKPGGNAFNPLLLYGGVGLGKTHLAQAIGIEVKKNYPNKTVLYVQSEKFITQFIESIK